MPEIALAKVNPEAPLDGACLFACGALDRARRRDLHGEGRAGLDLRRLRRGLVGLGAVAGCRLQGAERIVGVDLSEDRLAAGPPPRRHRDDGRRARTSSTRIVEMTGGFGADYTFEATGNVAVMRQAVESARDGAGASRPMIGVAGKGETARHRAALPDHRPARRRLVVRRRQGPRRRCRARRPLARRRHRRRRVHLAPHHARRGQPRLRADGGARTASARYPVRLTRFTVIIERAEHPGWLSNAYLVADRRRRARRAGRLERGHGPAARAGRARGHHDHARAPHAPPPRPRGRRRAARASASACRCSPTRWRRAASTASTRRSPTATRSQSGDLEIAGHRRRPGHCRDHLALLVNGTDCLTADCLFKGTVGGTMGGGRDRATQDSGALDHGAADDAAARDARPPGAPRADHDRRRSGSTTRSSASGAALDPEGDEPCTVARRARRRSSSGRPTTTAATRPGCASPTAATRSSAARPSSASRARPPGSGASWRRRPLRGRALRRSPTPPA